MIIASTASDSLGYAFYGAMHSGGVGIAKWWRIHMLFANVSYTVLTRNFKSEIFDFENACVAAETHSRSRH
jgi:hypothetical protein